MPEDLTLQGQSVENYRDIALNVQPVLPDPAKISAAASTIAGALRARKSVIVLIGFGAVRSGAGPELQAFLERFQIPFATTLDGKGIIAEDHPLSLGVFADSGHAAAGKAFVAADLVIAVGNSFAQHATFDFRPDLLAGKTLIHVNISAQEINKVYSADHAVIADAKLAVAALTTTLSPLVDTIYATHVEKDKHTTAPLVNLEPNHVHPGQLAQSLSKMLPDNGIVLADAGAHLAWLGYFLQLRRGQHYRKPGSFGPMAWAVNGALGTKIAFPDRPVIVGCGDGCYLLSGFELLTAVRYNIPVIWIIFDDGEYKLIKLYQLSAYHESGLVDFVNPDYVGYAKACGALGFRVNSLAEFEAAFQAALASGKPTLIDAAITRLALPHYSSNPDGVLAAIEESVLKKLEGD
ncbi:MAG: thiamine pyrophosphate-dependent enzyme [Xanthobacteraceae bacterium]